MSDNHSETTDDLSALAWVQEELRRSLEAAHKALRRFVKDAEAVSGSDVDAVDPAVLRTAHQQIHQGVGALELVGLPAVASVLRASEAAVKRFVLKPQKMTSADVDVIEQTSFALLDYLQRLLAGKPLSPLALFPRYRDVQAVAGADRVHPADLWVFDWQWREVPAEPGVTPRAADASARTEMEQQMLLLMRGQQATAAGRMSDLCAGLGAGASDLAASTLWKLAGAFFQAQAQGLLQADVFGKRVASRLLAQLRIFERGESEVSERLAQDLLFFCAQSPSPADGSAPRVAAVRQAYDLASHVPVDYEVSRLGRFDPAWVTQAKKRVSSAKDAWSGVAGGEMHRLGGLSEQFSLVGDSLRRLYPSGEVLADELQQAIVQTQQSGAAPETPLAMEVATSVLYLESSLEDTDFDHPEQAQRVRRLAQRIAGVRAGQTPDPLEAWMEELYRRVSDRQTMGSVVQELRASLAEVEKQIDQFFRKPAERDVLMPVPGQLSSMRGVMSVLGMDQATQALLRMRDDVEGLIATEVDPQGVVESGTFDRLAGNLGALGFLIDMLGAQPQVAKSLFVFDPHTGALSPLMGRSAAARNATNLAVPKVAPTVEPRVIEQAQALAEAAVSERMPLDALSNELEHLQQEAQAADQPGLVATIEQAQQNIEQAQGLAEVTEAREQLSEALNDFVITAGDAVALDPLPLPVAKPAQAPAPVAAPVAAPAPAAGTPGADLADDPEMREIFLEEAREKVGEARDSLAQLATAPGDVEQLTAVRRAFHTFKGSSRMVGLKEFGDAAWACEQLYNTWLAGQNAATPALLDFSHKALNHLADWIEAIAAQTAQGWKSGPLVQAAEAFGRGEPVGDIATPSAEAADLPLMSLSLDTPAEEPVLAPAPAEVLPVADALPVAEAAEAFDLDLDLSPVVEAAAEPVADVVPAPVPAAEALPELSFDLDLGAFDDAPPVTVPPAAEPADAPVVDLTAGLPAEEAVLSALDAPEAVELDALPTAESVELIELDLGDDVFGDAVPAAEATPVEEPRTVIEPRQDTAPGALAELPAVDADHFDIPFDDAVPAAEAEPAARPAAAVETVEFAEAIEAIEEAVEDPAPFVDDDQVRIVGPLRISIPLFNIYLNEADELSRKLTTEVAEWAMELHRPVGEMPIALAHSLAGSSATVGFADLSQLARTLEHALMRSQAIGHGTPEEGRLFVDAAEEVRRLLHQFAAGFLKAPAPELLERLAEHEVSSARRLEEANAAVDAQAVREDDEPDLLLDAEPDLLLDVAPPAADTPVQDTRPGALEADLKAAEAEALALPEVQPEPQPEPEPEPEAVAPAPVDARESAFGALPEPGELGQAEFKAFTPLPVAAPVAHSAPFRADRADEGDEDIDAVDAVDAELFPIFEEEAEELLPQLSTALRDWARQPENNAHAASCMRTLHTLKGGARLAGAMRLGEMAHRLETAIEHLLQAENATTADVERLESRADALSGAFENLKSRDAQAYAEAEEALDTPTADEPVVVVEPHTTPAALEAIPALPVIEPVSVVPLVPSLPSVVEQAPDTAAAPLAEAEPEPVAVSTEIDWSRFADSTPDLDTPTHQPVAAANAAVRVRGPLLERMVNQAGEVSITRSRIEAEVGNIRGSLGDLTDNLERLRQQLRDIEFQAETQMISRQEAAKAAHETFDPLESDRFTRFQELTRMMAESVNDVATVQRTLQRTLETTEDELAAQARLTRDLQDDLLRTRMVEFESQSDRLYRVVRQAAKETGKQVRLDIIGGSIEIDRGVLDRMTPAFEHLLRNCVTHGIEAPEVRTAAGKDAAGNIVVVLRQEGNEVGVEFRDDGAGLNLKRIRDKAEKMGLIAPGSEHSDGELANLIFMPGFSTAETVTELAGRGVGMDVVRSEVNAMGGRIETATAAGQGTGFTLVLPLTTAVTQVVMLRCGDSVVAVPATLIEIVRRLSGEEIEHAYQSGSYTLAERSMLFFWFGALLQQAPVSAEAGRTRPVVVVRSAQQRVALHVDEVLGTQEVVVKNLGPQLSRLPGLAGMTLLASGSVALIYNPVALATLYGDAARQATQAARLAPAQQVVKPTAEEASQHLAPLVLVVDDSLTVRRVTQRLLTREGFRVTLAKDGIEALERLAEERPQVVLSDIEMPRMDGFDLARNIRGDARMSDLPIIMITSRIAQKHRDYAAELGVDHYLGKPYSEEDLLALIARYTTSVAAPA